MSKNENRFLDSLNVLKKLEQELVGNSHAINELKQLQFLFESYSNKLEEKTDELEKSKIELEKQIKRADRFAEIGESASRLTHNLRNPLTVIISTVKIIEAMSKNSLDKKSFSRLERITDATSNMSHQIEEVLNFVRDKPLDLEEHSLSKILQSALKNLEISKTVNIHLPENDFKIKCDNSKFQVIFMNLITNATQVIQNNGDVFIRANNDSDHIVIEVEDSGNGIPEGALPKIFDSLFTTKDSGTGLGLPYCKTTVEQHGGTISVKNNPTTFTITLPKTSD